MLGEHQEIRDKDLDRMWREKYTGNDLPENISVHGFCLPETYNSFAKTIENFKVRDDDIWVCSFPRSGTTWTQEMIWCIANDLDFDGAKVALPDRFPHFEFSIFRYAKERSAARSNADVSEWFDTISYVDKLASPRFIKCHLPFELLPLEIREGTKKPKIIYVSRDPKDTCFSYFHLSQLLKGFIGSFEDFCRLFLAGKLWYTSYWNHVRGFWRRRNNENILFLKYEDMKTDLASVIRKSADFLGKFSKDGWTNNDIIDTNIEKLTKHLSFESMKSNAAVNQQDYIELVKEGSFTDSKGKFIRKGEKDQWKNEMPQEICDKFDKLTRELYAN